MKTLTRLVFPLQLKDSDGNVAIYSKGIDLKELYVGLALAGYAVGGTIMGHHDQTEWIALRSIELANEAIKLRGGCK